MEKEDLRIIRAYTSNLLRNQVDFLKNQIVGVKYDDDIEFVHHTRVSSRRIRNIIQVFSKGIGNKTSKKWTKNLRGLTKSLTYIRDLDVQLDFLDKYYSSNIETKYKQGLNRLILRKKQKRNALQGKILNDIDNFDRSKTLIEIDKFIKQHSLPTEESLNLGLLSRLAEDTIDSLIKNVFAYVPYIMDPNNSIDLHKMRIAIKNLRYSTELFTDLNPDISGYLPILKSLQDFLGEIHDCDVWQLDLEKFQIKEQNRILNFYGKTHPYQFIQPGIIFLSQDIKTKRSSLYDEFINYWNKINKDLFWINFRNVFTQDIARDQNHEEIIFYKDDDLKNQ